MAILPNLQHTKSQRMDQDISSELLVAWARIDVAFGKMGEKGRELTCSWSPDMVNIAT